MFVQSFVGAIANVTVLDSGWNERMVYLQQTCKRYLKSFTLLHYLDAVEPSFVGLGRAHLLNFYVDSADNRKRDPSLFGSPVAVA